jgi:hypothetical protein
MTALKAPNEAVRQDFGHAFAGTFDTRTELYGSIAIVLGPPAKPEENPFG